MLEVKKSLFYLNYLIEELAKFNVTSLEIEN